MWPSILELLFRTVPVRIQIHLRQTAQSGLSTQHWPQCLSSLRCIWIVLRCRAGRSYHPRAGLDAKQSLSFSSPLALSGDPQVLAGG